MQNAKCRADAAEREQRANLFVLCQAARRKSLRSRVNAECRMQNAEPTLRSESRGQTCLRYAKPQGGKACEAGLMQN